MKLKLVISPDLAALMQAGFDQAVASLGTAFTPAQARLLGRYTRRVAVSYDGDAAGSAATLTSSSFPSAWAVSAVRFHTLSR